MALLTTILLASCRSPASLPSAPAPEDAVTVVPLRFASAVEVAAILNELTAESRRACRFRGCVLYEPLQQPEQLDPVFQFGADPNTNCLRIRSSPEDLPRVLELVARLDSTNK